MMSWRGILVMVVAVAFVAGDRPVRAEQSTVTPEDVMNGAPLGSTGDTRTSIDESEVLALSQEMREFIQEHVNPGGTDVFKLQQLIDAFMGTKDFRLKYDEYTRTAAETFRQQKGNCLSFTTLFVALARGARLKADFQEVEIPPDWSTGKKIFVLNRHINVVVDLGAAGTRAVDFNDDNFQSTYKIEQISDGRAAAHFFNNMGVERMQAGDLVDAVAYFRRAIIESDGLFSPAWTNLGFLYRRGGHFDYAEAAYLQAIEVDAADYVAKSNLVSLYEDMGDEEMADRHRKKVDQHRMRNPHLRYRLARKAFVAEDYDAAIDHLKFATRKSKDEAAYFYLLGACYHGMGDEEKARKWTAKAEKLAATDEERQEHLAEIDELIEESKEDE